MIFDVLHVLEGVREGEADGVWQDEGDQSAQHSHRPEHTQREDVGHTPRQLRQIFADKGGGGPAKPGHGAAGAHRRGPDGGGVELGGVDVGHVEGGRHGGLGTEGRLQIYEVRKWANSSSNAM